MMRLLTLIYSSCVKHSVLTLFLDLNDHLDLHIYGGDAPDAFSPSTGLSLPTFVSVYEEKNDCYRNTFGKDINIDKVITLPISPQGYLRPGRL